jgi:phosphopantothenoylcysteine decarboxylase/phosphopantothenate--cysteine ligase
MGFALATAAFGRGAEVTLITGPTSLEPPFGVDVVTVESTEDLRGAMAKQVHSAEVVVMPTVDVLESTKHLRTEGCLAIGFALETSDGVENARDKLMRKGLDLIVLNMANEPGAGFEEETNRVTLVGADSLTELPILPKAEVAERILDAVEALA